VMAATTTRDLAWYRYLSQDQMWVPKGRPPLLITEMDVAWRYNAANWLLKRAARVSRLYAQGQIAFIFGTLAPEVIADGSDGPVYGRMVPCFAPRGEMAELALDQAMDEEDRARDEDPQAWMKTTPLYQALVAGIPADIAELARHWSTCALRTAPGVCDCRKRHLAECPVNRCRDVTAPCHCDDNSPAWTDD
jgi:hypothetical protein